MGCCGDSEVSGEGGSNKNGEPVKFDPTFKGPIKDRGCTDVICLIIYIVCFLAFLLVGVWSFTQGDPRLLLYPTDSQGNLCGYGDFANRPNLFFFDLIDCYKVGPAILSTGCPTPQVCVASCPASFWQWVTLETKETVLGSYDAAGRADMICVDGVNAVTSAKVCVEECPVRAWSYLMADTWSDRHDMICRPGVDPMGNDSYKSVKNLVSDEECAAYYIESDAVVGRCIPAFITKLVDQTTGFLMANNTAIVDKYGAAVNGTELEESTKVIAVLLNAADYGTKIFQDVRASWWMILVGLLLGAIISFIWILLMRCLAGPIIWITLFAFVGLFTAATWYSFDKYVKLKSTQDYAGTFKFTTNLDYYLNLKETWLAFGIIAAVLLGIVLIILLFLRQRICIAVALIKEGSRAVGNMIFTLFWPLMPYVFQVIFAAYWGASALYLASSGTVNYASSNKTNVSVSTSVYNETSGAWDKITQVQQSVKEVINKIPCDPNANSTAGQLCSFLKYGNDQYTIYLQVYQLFMWFWIMNFIVALGQMVLAGAFASYYWAFNKPQDVPAFPVTGSLCRTLRYHLGSIAFGSLIVAIIQLIRVFLEYLDHKLNGSTNGCAKFLLKCLKCCFWCLEKCIRFLNKNAYIMIAIYGKNFCTSAKNAFFLIMRNIVRIAVVDKVTDFLMFIGKLMVVGAVGMLAFVFFSGDLANSLPPSKISDYVVAYTPSLNFYLVPVLIICIGTYVIASAFFSVYSMGVDTLFLCFLEDLERHDGSPEKPYYMNKELMEILGKKNTKRVNGEDKEKSGCCACC